MINVESIDKVKQHHLALFLSSYAATVCCGMLITWQFQNPMFMSMDGFRLVLWSIAVAAPSLTANTIMAIIFGNKRGMEAGPSFVSASLLTTIQLSVNLLFCHMMHWSFQRYVALVFFVHLVFAVKLALPAPLRSEKAQVPKA